MMQSSEAIRINSSDLKEGGDKERLTPTKRMMNSIKIMRKGST